MVLLENLGRALQVQRFLRPLVPRQLGNRFEVGADDLRLHRFATGALQAGQLPFDLLLGRFGQLQGLEPLAQLVDVAGFVLLPKLLADGFQLLAQDHLALALAELLLHLRLDVFLRVEHADLSLHVHEHPPQPLLD